MEFACRQGKIIQCPGRAPEMLHRNLHNKKGCCHPKDSLHIVMLLRLGSLWRAVSY